MYSEKIILTNPRRVPLSLTNCFDDSFSMCEEIAQCKTADELCKVVNEYDNHGNVWSVASDSQNSTRLIKKDVFGNTVYLIASKKEDPGTGKFADISDQDLIMELIARGYKVSK